MILMKGRAPTLWIGVVDEEQVEIAPRKKARVHRFRVEDDVVMFTAKAHFTKFHPRSRVQCLLAGTIIARSKDGPTHRMKPLSRAWVNTAIDSIDAEWDFKFPLWEAT